LVTTRRFSRADLRSEGEIMDRVKELLASPTPVTWLFYGDSITHGALHTWGARDYTELFAERLRFELGRVMDVVINTANNGDTTRGLVGGFEWRVARFEPHVVFIMIGMNDCSDGNDITLPEFEANLDELLDKIAGLGGRAVLQTTCPILPGGAPEREPHFDAFMAAVRAAAAQRELPLIDHQAHWAENADKHCYWLDNAFHPNAVGHRVFANLLFKDLGIYDPASACCRFFHP